MRQFTEKGGYRKHCAALRNPNEFYVALLRKLIPGLSNEVIALPLKDGNIINVDQFMTLFIYKEIFADRCYDIHIDRAEPQILDIGANTGLFALRMKQLFPTARVTCYEPFPPNFEQLQRTIKLNQLDGVSPVPKAVGAKKGSAELYIHERNVGGHSFYPAQASSQKSVTVEVIDLDTVLDGFPDQVDLLKLDCEGAEFDILTSSTHLAGKVQQIVLEPSPRLYDIKDLLRRMEAVGFQRRWREGLYHFWRVDSATPGNA
jgi:FkbM family methyltransferase